MKISTLQDRLAGLLFDGCAKSIPAFKSVQKDEKIYAFVIFCDSGFTSMSPALSTRESLAKHKMEIAELGIQVSDNYLEVCVAEWAYLGINYELFNPIVDLMDEFYSILYGEAEYNDSQFEDWEINTDDDYENVLSTAQDIFVDAIVQSLKRLKAEGFFSGTLFEDDILLGLGFPDPIDTEVELMVKASEKINSEYWHNKVLKLQKYGDSNIVE